MTKSIIGLLVGILLTVGSLAVASPGAIGLFVDGKEIVCDVPPQIIDGRVMAPARFVAEALGAEVEWDAASNTVIITSTTKEVDVMMSEPQLEQPISEQEPVPDELTQWWPPKKITVIGAWVPSQTYSYWSSGDDLFISLRLASDILQGAKCYDAGRNIKKKFNIVQAPGRASMLGISLADLNASGIISIEWDKDTRTLYVNQ